MLKTRKWREKIHFKISHFNIVGIWIKFKKMKKLHMYIKEAKNYSKLVMFILVGPY